MSSYYSYYKSNNKPTVRTINNKEEAIRRYEQALERKQSLTNTPSSFTISYKTAFLVACGGLLVGLGLLIYSIGYKSGKRKYKYRCKS